MGLLEVTFVVLLVLKLAGIAQINWLIVFSPLVVSIVIWVILLVLFSTGVLVFRKRLK